MHIDIPTLAGIAAVTSGALALALALGLRIDIAANLGGSLRIWATGIAIQALGWLLLGFRGAIPDALGVVVANVAIVLGFAECVNAVRSFGGRSRSLAPYLAVLGVLAASIVFTFVEPSRYWRMTSNSALLAVLLAMSCREVLRLESQSRQRPRSHWLVAAIFALGATMLLGRVVKLGIDGSAPTVVPMTVIIFYASVAFGPVVASLGFALMCADRLDRELTHLANVDPLTGAYNRRSLETFAQREIVQSKRHGHDLMLLLLDLDHFKEINDAYGHAAGDEVLREVTQTLRAAMREGDLLSRLSGEEFVVLMPHTDRKAGQLAAERLRAAVAGMARPMSISIGVADWQPDDSLEDLLRIADQALYRAKKAGRNRVELALRQGLSLRG